MWNIWFPLLIYICLSYFGSLLFTTNPWNGVAKGDKSYNSILSSINILYDGINNGRMKSLIVYNDLCPSWMYYNSMKSGERCRKCTNKRIQLEKKMDTWCAKHWENNKKITRGIIFRQAIVFDSTFFCGGLSNPNIFMALKNWFYGGFKKQSKLFRRVVS